jgi:hypothetical protein
MSGAIDGPVRGTPGQSGGRRVSGTLLGRNSMNCIGRRRVRRVVVGNTWGRKPEKLKTWDLRWGMSVFNTQRPFPERARVVPERTTPGSVGSAGIDPDCVKTRNSARKGDETSARWAQTSFGNRDRGRCRSTGCRMERVLRRPLELQGSVLSAKQGFMPSLLR